MKKFVLLPVLAILVFTSASCTFKKTQQPPVQVGTSDKAGSGYVDTRSDVLVIESSDSGTLSQEMTNSGITSSKDLMEISAVNTGDKKRCEELPTTERQACVDTINFDDGVFLNDYAKCDLIESDAMKSDCRKKVSEGLAKTAGSLSACSKIQDPSIRSACETRVKSVVSPTSSKSCEALTVPADKLQCFDQLILTEVRTGKTTDSTVCGKVTNPVLKKECNAWMARNTTLWTTGSDSGEEGSCVGRTGTSLQYCLKDAAVETAMKTGDVSACSTVTDATVRIACTKDVSNALARKIFDEAMAKKDPSLCSKITDSALRSKCEAIVSK